MTDMHGTGQHRRFVQDRRVRKTQTLLREALVSLVREKNYDSIVVKEILERANVGRSTFYSHFRDKDELLASGIREMLRPAQSAGSSSSTDPHESIISFSLPFFEFIDQHRRGSGHKMREADRAVVHEHLRKVLTERIANDVITACRGRRTRPSGVPSGLLAEHVASTFILVLNWWVDTGSSLSAGDVNDVFRALILPTLVAGV